MNDSSQNKYTHHLALVTAKPDGFQPPPKWIVFYLYDHAAIAIRIPFYFEQLVVHAIQELFEDILALLSGTINHSSSLPYDQV